MTDDKPLILYGVPFSQPVRAVLWLLIMKRVPFEMVLINPGSEGKSGSRNPAYLARNPGGTIPTIEEPDTGFVLGEAGAILCYLCRKHDFTDLYPAADRPRALVDWYLHFHHRTIRDGSVGLVAPRIRKDLAISDEAQALAQANFTKGLTAIERGWLAERRFLAGDSVTLADIAAYADIGQMRASFTNVFDFAPYVNVTRWLDDMAAVEGHDDVHVVLAEIGDISREPPSMETIRAANKRALAVLEARAAAFLA